MRRVIKPILNRQPAYTQKNTGLSSVGGVKAPVRALKSTLARKPIFSS